MNNAESSSLSSQDPQEDVRTHGASNTFTRLAKYAIVKAVSLFLAVMVGLYLTILIVNLGGYVDKVFESDVIDIIDGQVKSGAFRDMTY
jgi:hypothetical protein